MTYRISRALAVLLVSITFGYMSASASEITGQINSSGNLSQQSNAAGPLTGSVSSGSQASGNLNGGSTGSSVTGTVTGGSGGGSSAVGGGNGPVLFGMVRGGSQTAIAPVVSPANQAPVLVAFETDNGAILGLSTGPMPVNETSGFAMDYPADVEQATTSILAVADVADPASSQLSAVIESISSPGNYFWISALFLLFISLAYYLYRRTTDRNEIDRILRK